MKSVFAYILERNRATEGWSFPPKVKKLLKAHCHKKSVLHLFGGFADFGTRLDIDPDTLRDVIGDAWLPPFAKDSFEIVILDPPYFRLNSQEKNAFFRVAGWIARGEVIWFSTFSLGWAPGMKLEQSIFVRKGNICQVRILEFYSVQKKLPPVAYFTRGPAIKYNHWLRQPEGFSFEETPEKRDGTVSPKTRSLVLIDPDARFGGKIDGNS